MALIVKCRKCRRRLSQGVESCPDDGCTALRYIIDYWPNGRSGGRKQVTLPDGTGLEDARKYEARFHVVRKGQHKEADPYLLTVADLFPDYLKWYQIRRAPGSYRDVGLIWEATIRPILGHYHIRDISPEHFSLYQQARASRVKNRTINKKWITFPAF